MQPWGSCVDPLEGLSILGNCLEWPLEEDSEDEELELRGDEAMKSPLSEP
jgi:hypothetical protein